MDGVHLLTSRELLTNWYLEYMDQPGSALEYETWYLIKGKDKLFEYLTTWHDEYVRRFAKELLSIKQFREAITA